MFVLPQILLLGDHIIEKTSFNIDIPVKHRNAEGSIFVDGLIRGEVHGTIHASVHGVVEGSVNATVISGTVEDMGNAENTENTDAIPQPEDSGRKGGAIVEEEQEIK